MRSTPFLAFAGVAAASLAPAFAATRLVPQQYPTIQKALNAAKSGDTVLVSSKKGGAVYNEAVTLSKSGVTLQGSGNPVIDGTGLGTVVQDPPFAPYTVFPNGVEVRASHVAVRGVIVQNFGGTDANSPGSGINVGYFDQNSETDVSFSDVEISGCTTRNDYNGITLLGVNGNAFLTGYKVQNNVVTACNATGAIISAGAALISGNQFMHNNGDGLDAEGSGLTVTGNESGFNAVYGLAVVGFLYNPAVNTPGSPNPAPDAVTFNSLHDNAGDGIEASGTLTLSGNVLSHNTGRGLYLSSADYSTITGNSITGTGLLGFNSGDGDGLYADFSYNGGPLTISYNQVSGNAGDGIALNYIGGSLVTFNAVTSNSAVGIHLSDYVLLFGGPPNTVSYNLGQHNSQFDAKDDTSAPDADGFATTPNIWTRNLFGKTDPANLSK